MIELCNVSKSYPGKDRKAVDDLTWTVSDGRITGFFGPNGAGKSTTLKMICGVHSIDEGSIKINGHDIATDAVEAKRQFGYVPDDPDRFLRLTGIEYLNFMADVYGTPVEKREPFIEECGRRFEIYDALGSRISDYSHGMRQKVHVMAALIHEPSVWILDEPMTGLDPKGAYELKEMMREHAARGNSVLFSTHVLDVAEKLCNKVAIISHGKLVAQGDMDSVKGDDSLEELFMELVEKE